MVSLICSIFLFFCGIVALFEDRLEQEDRIDIGCHSRLVALFYLRQFFPEDGDLFGCIDGDADTVGGTFNDGDADIIANEKAFIFLRLSISIILLPAGYSWKRS